MRKGLKLDRRSFLTGLGAMLAWPAMPSLNWPKQTAQKPAPNELPGRLGDLNDSTIFDVCIVGSGFAGAVLGEELARSGVRVIILESGSDASDTPIDPRFRELEVFRSSGAIEYPIVSSRFRGVGGTSALWTGRCPRLDPLDFAEWPITYTDLEPYYDKAEERLRVRGGQLSEYNPPRKHRLPLPPNRDISTLKSLLLKAGVVVDDAPTSTGDDGHSPMKVAESFVPAFQSSPHGTLVSAATVTRLLTDDNGTVVGAEVKDLDRNVKIIRARAYVVACGALESPRLLLLSRSRRFPNGIGNDYDWVGRCFMEHKGVNFSGRVKTNGFFLYPQVGRSYQFYKAFKEQHLGGTLLGFRLMSVMPSDLRNWKLTELWGRLSAISGRMWQPVLIVGAGPETPPLPENRVTLHKELKDYFGNPVLDLFLHESAVEQQATARLKALIQKIYADLQAEQVDQLDDSWSHHHMGTCRMGDNPRTSVVDRNLLVHGTSNLFLSGSAVFVTSGAANPTLTLTALALRLADSLRSHLQVID